MDVCNAVVVVTRWYGGIHLGPDRFKHINSCARSVVQETGIGLQMKELERPNSSSKSRKRKK
jgi:putative IMPACT (imprinted ancient) family translation regulator